jgi:hypothetical protein
LHATKTLEEHLKIQIKAVRIEVGAVKAEVITVKTELGAKIDNLRDNVLEDVGHDGECRISGVNGLPPVT